MHLSVAILVAMALLAVFIYPLTFGPPAPLQKQSLVSLLLACLLPVILVIAPTAALPLVPLDPSFAPVSRPSERLALICIRLC